MVPLSENVVQCICFPISPFASCFPSRRITPQLSRPSVHGRERIQFAVHYVCFVSLRLRLQTGVRRIRPLTLSLFSGAPCLKKPIKDISPGHCQSRVNTSLCTWSWAGVLSTFFKIDHYSPPPRASWRHFRHVIDPCPARAPDYLLRSALGGVKMYNLLPDAIAHAPDAQTFKKFCLSSCVLLRRGVLRGRNFTRGARSWPFTAFDLLHPGALRGKLPFLTFRFFLLFLSFLSPAFCISPSSSSPFSSLSCALWLLPSSDVSLLSGSSPHAGSERCSARRRFLALRVRRLPFLLLLALPCVLACFFPRSRPPSLLPFLFFSFVPLPCSLLPRSLLPRFDFFLSYCPCRLVEQVGPCCWRQPAKLSYLLFALMFMMCRGENTSM